MRKKAKPNKQPKRGQSGENKIPKVLMTISMIVIGVLILALVISVIVVATKTKKKPEDNRLEGIALVRYQDLEHLFEGNITILGEDEQSKPAMEELVKKESVIFFLTADEIKDDEILEQLKAFPTKEKGALLYILTDEEPLLKPEDTLLKDVENVDKALKPFVIRVTETASKFEFIGGLELVKNILKEGK